MYNKIVNTICCNCTNVHVIALFFRKAQVSPVSSESGKERNKTEQPFISPLFSVSITNSVLIIHSFQTLGFDGVAHPY